MFHPDKPDYSLEEAALAISSPPPKGEVRAIVVPKHD
jgi:hypothetical protein